jgi:hypothetical protein
MFSAIKYDQVIIEVMTCLPSVTSTLQQRAAAADLINVPNDPASCIPSQIKVIGTKFSEDDLASDVQGSLHTAEKEYVRIVHSPILSNNQYPTIPQYECNRK